MLTPAPRPGRRPRRRCSRPACSPCRCRLPRRIRPGASPGRRVPHRAPRRRPLHRTPCARRRSGSEFDWDTGCVHWPAGWLRILRPGTGPATCTQVGNVEMGTVVASPADDAASGPAIVGKTPTGMTPAVKSALEVISADLLAGCYARDEAVARLSNALIEAGASGFVVRTDGPIGGPKDRIDEIMAHVDAGCVIYGGSGATGDGTPVFYVGADRGTDKHVRARCGTGVVGLAERFAWAALRLVPATAVRPHGLPGSSDRQGHTQRPAAYAPAHGEARQPGLEPGSRVHGRLGGWRRRGARRRGVSGHVPAGGDAARGPGRLHRHGRHLHHAQEAPGGELLPRPGAGHPAGRAPQAVHLDRRRARRGGHGHRRCGGRPGPWSCRRASTAPWEPPSPRARRPSSIAPGSSTRTASAPAGASSSVRAARGWCAPRRRSQPPRPERSGDRRPGSRGRRRSRAGMVPPRS